MRALVRGVPPASSRSFQAPVLVPARTQTARTKSQLKLRMRRDVARAPYMRTLTSQLLQKLFPGLSNAKAVEYAPHFSAAASEAKIDTRARLCAFVAQLGHESLDLKHLKEIWQPTPAQRRYDTRVDLGNTPEADGDGKDYLGRGGLQRTGKKNYRRFQEATGVPVVGNPKLLELPQFAFRSDALYWTDNNLNRIADQLTLRGDAKDLATLDKITKRINGGYNGRVDRQRRYLVAIATLPAALFEPEPEPVQTSALDLVATHLNQPAATNPAPEDTKPVSDVLLAKLSKSEGVKTVGTSLARRIAFRLGGPLGLLYAALAAGDIYAWLGLAVLLAVLLGAAGFVVHYYRHELHRCAKRQLERITR